MEKRTLSLWDQVPSPSDSTSTSVTSSCSTSSLSSPCFTPTSQLSPCRKNQKTRPQCFVEAETDESILTDRKRLTDMYLKEVQLLQHSQQHSAPILPQHIPVLEQSRGCDLTDPTNGRISSSSCGKRSKTVRVLQWNINVLHGPDNIAFSMPQQAHDIAAQIKAVNADVVFLQEAWKLGYSKDASPPWPDSADRVQQLLTILREELGYTLINTEHTAANNNFNPCLLATRLPIVQVGPTFSLDAERHLFHDRMLAHKIPELRAGRIVELSLTKQSGNNERRSINPAPESSKLDHSESTQPQTEAKGCTAEKEEKVDTETEQIYHFNNVRQLRTFKQTHHISDWPNLQAVITHFHHNEAAAAAEGFGIRLGEAKTIIDECDKWVKAQTTTTVSKRPNSATILATDFNGTRQRDFLPQDWEQQKRCMARINQPADDGVATCLEQNDFKCTYDAENMSVPCLTHWSNTVVDFAYLRENEIQNSTSHGCGSSTKSRPKHEKTAHKYWTIKGTYVIPSTLSDHLPVIHDIECTIPRTMNNA